MKVCSQCAAEYEDHLVFCRRDGTALISKPVEKTCFSCGREVGALEKFCRQCGESVARPVSAKGNDQKTLAVRPASVAEKVRAEQRSEIERAEECLREKNFRDAISVLDTILGENPHNQEARLLHLYASVKLYNIYGYEKQIESLRSLSDLNEKETDIAREIFVIRADEAQKRGQTAEAREYQRLATRVVLGKPLAEAVSDRPATPSLSIPRESRLPGIPPRINQERQSSARQSPRKVEIAPSYAREPRQTKKRNSRLVISFVLVFGLAGILAAGMLAYYAKKQGVNVSDIFTSKRPVTKQPEGTPLTTGTSSIAQVLPAEDLGFKISGDAAGDANRQPSVVSNQINSQLSELRRLYEEEVQKKPDLMGSVILQLTISPAGIVTKVDEYAARIRDDEFKKIVIDEAYKWTFPEARSGLVKVNYPLMFVAPGTDAATLIKMEQVIGPEGQKYEEPSFGATDVAKLPAKPVPPPSAPTTTESPKPKAIPRPDSPGVTNVPTHGSESKDVGAYEVRYSTSVYSQPRDDAETVGQIEAGTKVNVVNVQGDWLEIRSKYGRPPGFIKKDSAVRSTVAQEVPQQPQTITKERPILGPYQVIRRTFAYSAPREDSQRVAWIAPGRRIEVVDVQGDWLEILTNRGRLFIKKDFAVSLRSR